MLEFLPPRIASALRYVNLNRLYELRMRRDKPLLVSIGGEFCFLGERGVCAQEEALCPTAEEIAETLFAASEYSLYSVENQMKQGFVTGKCGERIGVAGTYVYENGAVHAVREITSLCVRVPHEVRGCAEEIYRRCFERGIASLLLLAPPGEGKTTVLRDLTRLLCERKHVNTLVSDERGELSAGDLGPTADVVAYADKRTAFTAGIRAMRPDLIVTDELLEEDYPAVKRALKCGISVLASAHLRRAEDVPERLFSWYVRLDGLGKVGEILDSELHDVD